MVIPNNKVKVVFCNVGQGDSALVISGNFEMLIDTGSAKGNVEKCLDENLPLGDKKLEVVLLSHLDSDHSGALENLKKYDYIEVMACPDGCVGGGGQPIPTTKEIIKKRLEALYKIDAGARVRRAHENKEALSALRWLKDKGKLREQVLYTKYRRRK